MKNNLKLLSIGILLLATVISGCRDMHNVDELAIVLGVGIDRIQGEEPILLSVQIVNTIAAKGPSGEGGSQDKQFVTLTSQGKSMLDAVRNLVKTSSRKIIFSHNKIIVLGKNFAESDISEVMDYIQRNREFRPTNLIVIAEQTAKEVLETKLDIAKLPAIGLHSMLMSKDQTFIYPVNLNDFLLNLKTDIGVSYAPLVHLEDPNQENNAKIEQATAKPKLFLQELAIFKNNRLVGTLNDQESTGFLWLHNKLKSDILIIPYQIDGVEKPITLDIFKGSSKVIPHITDTDILMEIVCTGEAELSEVGYIDDQIKDLQVYERLEQETEKLLKAKLEKTIAMAQNDLHADFLGFGNQIHNHNPTEWHLIKADWDEYFPRIKYSVVFHITVSKAGVTKGSAKVKHNQE